MPLRVLTWNLMHGRSLPRAGRDLLPEFTDALDGWEWDVALLQEVPPWWPSLLAAHLDADARLVLTSRNALLPVRRVIAQRRPDAIKSNGGGCNAILARGSGIVEHRTRRLCLLPERRWLHAARLSSALWVGNLHATVHNDAAARRDGALAASTMLRWADGSVALLGGDFNVRSLALAGFSWAAGLDVDHVFASGVRPVDGSLAVLDRGRLSDHAPVAVSVIDIGE
jgi:endonuclease/exonuclease/phosphatase family metal-dependent hydrolase